MIVFVLSFLFVSLLCGAVLARNASIIFSEFRNFSSSSSLSTCLFSDFDLCFLSPSFRMKFLEEDELLFLLSAETKETRQRVSVTEQHVNEGWSALAVKDCNLTKIACQ